MGMPGYTLRVGPIPQIPLREKGVIVVRAMNCFLGQMAGFSWPHTILRRQTPRFSLPKQSAKGDDLAEFREYGVSS